MLVKCTEADKPQIFNYIGEDYKYCLYAYADLKQYGLNKDFINAWLYYDINNDIKALVYNYHKGIHIFSRDFKYDAKEIAKLLLKLHPAMISARKEIIQDLIPFMLEYKHEFGYIIQKTVPTLERSPRVELAKESDIHEMAVMLYNDKGIGASYTVQDLEDEIRQRMEDKYGRSYVLKIDGVIAAQDSTSAEIDKFAISSLTIVDPRFRRMGLGTEINGSKCYDIEHEGKEIYAYCYEEPALIAWHKSGYIDIGEWGKLYVENQ